MTVPRIGKTTGFRRAVPSQIELRRRIHVGLNKGETRNALAGAVFFNRLGELRDRTYENQRYRVRGLNLVVAAIVLWDTVYLERAVTALRERGEVISDDLVAPVAATSGKPEQERGDAPCVSFAYHSVRTSQALSVQFCPFRGGTPNGAPATALLLDIT